MITFSHVVLPSQCPKSNWAHFPSPSPFPFPFSAFFSFPVFYPFCVCASLAQVSPVGSVVFRVLGNFLYSFACRFTCVTSSVPPVRLRYGHFSRHAGDYAMRYSTSGRKKFGKFSFFLTPTIHPYWVKRKKKKKNIMFGEIKTIKFVSVKRTN